MAAGKEISQLDPAGPLSGGEVIPTDQAGRTVKTTAQAIADLAAGGVSSVAGRTGTVVLAEADVAGLVTDLATHTTNIATNATNVATKQPVDADLTAIAALDSSTAGAIASDGAGWVSKTYAQFKTALGLSPTVTIVGDGTTDQTAAINAAIVAQNAAGGGVVQVTGVCPVTMAANSPVTNSSGAIIMRSNVTLSLQRGAVIKLGANQASVGSSGGAIIRNANPFLGTTYPMPTPDHDITITGEGTIDGNGANQSTVPTYGGTTPYGTTATNVYGGIRMDSVVRPRISDIQIKNIRGLGAGGTISGSSPATLLETLALAFYRCGDFEAHNVHVFSDDGGPTASGVGSNFGTVGRVTNCTTHHLTYGAGFTFYDSANVTVTNCHSYLNGGHGFLTEYSHDIFFDDCASGGLSSNDDRSANKIAVYSSDAGVGVSVGPATGGTFTLTVGGQTTSSLAYNASAATVLAALVALASVGASNATCIAGTPTGTYTTWSNWDIELINGAAGQAITGTSSLTAGIFRIVPHVILGNGQDSTNNYTAGFSIDTGNRVIVRGGMSAYNGVPGNVLAGWGVWVVDGTSHQVLPTTSIVVDGCRIFGNNGGVNLTFGDGQVGLLRRAKVTRIIRPDLVGPNKGQADTATNKEFSLTAGQMANSTGLIASAFTPAVAATTVAVDNPFPFDCDVVLAGGTVTAVTVTPGGPAPGAATTVSPPGKLFKVPQGGQITLTYGAPPTWKWFAWEGGLGAIVAGIGPTSLRPAASTVEPGALWIVAPSGSAALVADNVASLAQNAGSTSTQTVTFTATTTVGNHVILNVESNSSFGLVSVTDSAGNTWQVDKTSPHSQGPVASIASCKVTTGHSIGSTLTCTFQGAVSYVAAICSEWSGLDQTSWVDVTASGTGAGAAAYAAAGAYPGDPAAIPTRTQPDDLMVGCVAYTGTTNPTVYSGDGYTALTSLGCGSNNKRITPQYKVVSQGAAEQVRWTTNPGGFEVAAVAYKATLPARSLVISDGVTWTAVASGGTYTAANGLTLTSSAFSIDTSITVDKTTAQTLTNKTFTSPVVNTPTGIVKGDVGLGSVDNTADTAKPVSTAQQTALNLKANLASPTFTGTVTIPTGASITAPTGIVAGDIASGTFAIGRIPTGTTGTTVPLGGVVTGASVGTASQSLALTFNNAGQITAATANSIAIAESQVTNLVTDLGTLTTNVATNATNVATNTTAIALRATLASPTFTGTVTIPDPPVNTTDAATKNYVDLTELAIATAIAGRAGSYAS